MCVKTFFHFIAVQRRLEARAGVYFPVNRIHSKLKTRNLRVTKGSGLFIGHGGSARAWGCFLLNYPASTDEIPVHFQVTQTDWHYHRILFHLVENKNAWL